MTPSWYGLFEVDGRVWLRHDLVEGRQALRWVQVRQGQTHIRRHTCDGWHIHVHIWVGDVRRSTQGARVDEGPATPRRHGSRHVLDDVIALMGVAAISGVWRRDARPFLQECVFGRVEVQLPDVAALWPGDELAAEEIHGPLLLKVTKHIRYVPPDSNQGVGSRLRLPLPRLALLQLRPMQRRTAAILMGQGVADGAPQVHQQR
mmetsp:Transcript_40936/g.102281  ORF Transcript_40936/g.102281 Transcript_40936/m.102281 type:complete len:204 (+) Transcript_40936:441-1052(+)